MHDLRPLVVPTLLLLTAAACSFLAPSDARLLGDSQSVGSAAGAEMSGSITPTDSGGRAPAMQTGGGTTVQSAGGASAGQPAESGNSAGAASENQDLSSLIPQEKLLLWLMADRGVAQVEGAVEMWADQSANEADARQSIIPARPKLLPAVGNTPPMIELDGVDDQLVLPEGFNDFSAGLSAFVIARALEDQDCPSLLHLSNDPEHEDIEVGRFKGSLHYEVFDDEAVGPSDAFVLNQTLLLSVTHALSGTATLRINGAFMASGQVALPEVKGRANNFVGRSLYSGCKLFHGRIGEIILYGRALGSGEVTLVQDYLQKKWSYIPLIKSKPGPGQIPAL